MRKFAACLALIATTLLLAGCATDGQFCQAASPIRPSTNDRLTNGTIDQLLAHNLTGAELCGWSP
jgi:uncharacterized lipoprotein YajG